MFTATPPTSGPSAHHETFRHGEVLVPSLPGFKTRAQPKTGRVKGRAGELRRKFIAITDTTLFAATLMNFSAFTTATANAAQVTCTADAGYTNCVRFTYSGADQPSPFPQAPSASTSEPGAQAAAAAALVAVAGLQPDT